MSVQAVCDRCGITMGAVTEKDSRDVEIYIGDDDEPYFVAEDLCPNCMDEVRSVIDGLSAAVSGTENNAKIAARGDVAAPAARFTPNVDKKIPTKKPRPRIDHIALEEVRDERA